jgi:hypothetical protein
MRHLLLTSLRRQQAYRDFCGVGIVGEDLGVAALFFGAVGQDDFNLCVAQAGRLGEKQPIGGDLRGVEQAVAIADT